MWRRWPRRTAALAITLLLAVTGGSAGASPQDSPERPRVGLVLSGGGGKSIAHLGVIRWLEEHRVPVDLVAGTSMGGLMGGILATGADADEVEQLLDSIDWARVLNGDTPHDEKNFRRREDARFAPGKLEFGLRGGFRLPPGADSGHQVGLVIDRLALPYADIDSFDDLPIPFACVALDLVEGEEVVFRDGPLSLAMRATMSFPAWFAPVQYGDRRLVDGGALNNMPTDVMVQMAPDVIIAVDLSAEESIPEASDSALGVANRTVSIMMRKHTDVSDTLADILITPDVSAFGLAEFAHRDEMARVGYEAAERHAEELLAYALDEAAWQRYRERIAGRRRAFEFVPRTLEVTGSVGDDEARVMQMLRHHLDVPLDPERLDYDLTRITGAGRYALGGYSRGDGPEGPVLRIQLEPKTYGPPFVRPVLTMQGREFGDSTVEIGGRLTVWDLVGTGSEWRTDLLYGRLTGARTELFVPLGLGGLFVAPRAIIGEVQRKFYDAGEAVADYSDRVAGGGADVGYLFGMRSQLRAGVDVERRRVVVTTGRLALTEIEGTVGVARALWEYDGVNSATIPTAGLRARVRGNWVFESPGEEESLYQTEGSVFGAVQVAPRLSLLGTIAGGTTFDRPAPFLHQYLLGGPFRLGALDPDEVRGSKFFFGQAGVLWALSDPEMFSALGRFYLLAMYEVGDAFEEKAEPFHDATFGVAGDTLLGAVFVGGSIGEQGRRGFFLTLGRFF